MIKAPLSSWLYMIGGLATILIGIGVGLYFGFWWAFIGGIIDVVNAFKADDISALAVALGAAKVVFASAIGWVSFAFFFLTGKALLDAS
jgi:hypothetical protein